MATYTGDDGNNTYNGTEDADQASGGGGNDTLNGKGGADTLHGDDGDDVLDGGDGNDFLYGDAGADRIYGGAGDDQVFGGAGNDLILDGSGGNNIVDAGDGDDEVELDSANFLGPYDTNTVIGGAGNDHLILHGSNGSISGGIGNDYIRTERGVVTVDGGDGNDEIVLGQAIYQTDGVQTATGGSGADLFWITDTSRFNERDRILDFDAAAGDRLQLMDVDNANGRTGFYWAKSSGALVWKGALDPSLFVLGAALPAGDNGTGFVGVWTVQTGGKTYVIADSNANLVFEDTDMVVEFAGTVAIDRGSFTSGTFGALYGTAAGDTMNGTSGNDTIYGLGGDDTINGGPGGYDALYGGDGNDTLDASQSTRGALFGEAGNDILTGADGGPADMLEGGIGDDTLFGLKGDDQLFGGDGNDVVDGGDGYDLVDGGIGNDLLIGGVGQDSLDGFHGDDILRGGEGDDFMNGNVGNDTVDFSDIVGGGVSLNLALDGQFQNTGAAGFDRISQVENATGTAFIDTFDGTGTANVLKGLAGADVLRGLAGDDVLDGGAGADMMTGGADNDIYYVDDAGDQAIEDAGGGTDEIRTTLASFTLTDVFENLAGSDVAQQFTGNGTGNILRGEGGSDTLFGLGGADFLVGGAGDDIMVGGLGDDTYYIDDLGDLLSEFAGEGNDRIAASISLALAADSDIERIDVVNLTSTNALDLTGSGIANVIYGNDGVNILRGEAGNDELRGFGGSDFLVGGAGTDLMVGGLGNDTFYVDDASDAIGEIAGEGNDRIAASVSFVLSNGADVEIIEAVNVASTSAFDLIGSDSANTITGNAGVNLLKGEGGNDILSGAGGDDFLVGGSGNDVMNGGTGNDTYYVDVAGDMVIEYAGEGLGDRVATSVSYTLAATADIERLEAANSADTAAMDLIGSASGNSITGNNGANVLDGKSGSDTLTGLGGADTYQFTSAPGVGNVDIIVGFVTGGDRIALDDAIFGAIGPAGALNANAFFAGSVAHDADDRIIYDQTTGALLYDADGNGAGAAVQFATLSGNPLLAASDFLVI